MRKRKQQNNNKLIPKLPFGVNEVSELVNDPNSVLQEKLMEFSKTSAYKFLSDLNTNTVKAPTPGSDVKLSKKEMQLFEEYIDYKISPEYKKFQALQILVNEYDYKLHQKTREDAGILLDMEEEGILEHGDTIVDVKKKDKKDEVNDYDYAVILDRLDRRGRKYRIMQEINESEYNTLKYRFRANLPGIG